MEFSHSYSSSPGIEDSNESRDFAKATLQTHVDQPSVGGAVHPNGFPHGCWSKSALDAETEGEKLHAVSLQDVTIPLKHQLPMARALGDRTLHAAASAELKQTVP